MTKIGDFVVTGPASARRVRAAGLLDLLIAAIASMIVIPQPVVRGAVMSDGVTPTSIALFVLALLGAILLAFFMYLAFSAVTWGRTPGMYLLDLGLDTPSKPTTGEALRWAFGWTCAAVPAVLGVRKIYDPDYGWPARWSEAPTRSTA